ncbi:MAG: hypothetical protein SGI92_00045 [Bryobacteraceae bacterium]|nr:hypothetical protein [Bryobacteraceae bacterium]
MYACDKAPLEAKTESVDDTNPLWRKDKVSYAAAYGGERIPAYLYLPKSGSPPFQTVVFAPGGDARVLRNSETGIHTDNFDYLIRTGRAVLYPIYKGLFERGAMNEPGGPNARRDILIACQKDLARSVDYLETRPDIQSSRLAYYGISWGGSYGVIFVSVEPRIMNYAPRVRVPALMVNGRLDFLVGGDELARPLLRFLGSPAGDKRMVEIESGHVPPVQDLMREVLDWLDKYLGPVKSGSGG